MAQQNMHGGLPGREFDVVIKLNADTMSGMMRNCGSMLEQWNRLNADTMQFCAARWKEDLEVPARLARSQAPGDIAAVYAGFARKMLDDYSDQTRRVMDFVGALGREAVAADGADEAPAAVTPVEQPAPKAEIVAEAATSETAGEPVEKPAAPARSAAAKPAVATQEAKAEAEPAKAKPAAKAGRQAKPKAEVVAAKSATAKAQVKSESGNGAAKPKTAEAAVKKAQ